MAESGLKEDARWTAWPAYTVHEVLEMEKPNIVATYAYDDGAIVNIADSAYKDKNPEQIERIWEMAQIAAMNCVRASNQPDSTGRSNP